MKRSIWLLAALAGLFALSVAAQEPPYTEGTVTQVVSIKVAAGHADEYAAYLANTWVKQQEALKAAGIIVGYAAYSATPRGPGDANVYLTTTYANMAALDGLAARSDAAIAKALGTTPAPGPQAMAQRNAYRELLGIELVREMKFK